MFAAGTANQRIACPITGGIRAARFTECDFSITLHKREVGVSVVYHIEDADTVLRNIAKDVQSDWYDSENGKMGLIYGMITVGLGVDPRVTASMSCRRQASLAPPLANTSRRKHP